MNNTDWADKPNNSVKYLRDCSTLCDLAYLVMKDMGYEYNHSNQKEKDNEPTIIESWSLLEFAKENGAMKVTAPMTHVNTKTGEEFLKRKCAFIHPTKKDDQGKPFVIFVDFSPEIGELTPNEISAQQNDLIVVKYESGWYVLERKQDNRTTNEINRNAIEDILNTAITDYEKANAWTDEYGIQYSSDGRKLLMVPKDIVNYSIKKGTKAICNMAFRNCKELKSITIPDGLTLIGYSAFEGCSNLETIDIPNSVLSIGVNAFWGCIRLYSVNISNQIKSIRNATFVDCKSIMSIKIPDSVKSIGIAAFSNCENLMFVDIPTNVNYIGQQAFHNCRRLSSISIPYSVTVIESGIFSGCSSLKSIDIKNGITNIRDGAFYDCPQLNSIIITMGTIEKIRKQLPEHLHDKIIEKDRRNEKATEVQALDEVVTSWMYQGFIKGYKRVKTGSAYCPFTGNEENVLVFEEGNGGNTIVYNLSGLSVEQINEKKEMLSIEFRQSGYYFLNNSDVADVIESRSTLLYTEEWDGNTIPNIEKEDSPDNTADYNFADSWSILDFAKIHGKMRVEQRKDNETGEEFTSLSFTDSIGRVINVHSFNLEDISLYQILRKIDYYRIGAAPLQYYYPSYYYLYNKTLSFWLPGMSI